LRPVRALKRVLFPQFGLPTSAKTRGMAGAECEGAMSQTRSTTICSASLLRSVRL
jgi:hypothetical protein